MVGALILKNDGSERFDTPGCSIASSAASPPAALMEQQSTLQQVCTSIILFLCHSLWFDFNQELKYFSQLTFVMSYVSAYVYVFELKILWGYPESQWVNVEIRQLKCFSTWYTINSSIFCLDLFNGLEARLGQAITL